MYKGGRVLSIANNKYHNDPRIFPPNAMNSVSDKIGVHAEVAALRCLSPEQRRGAIVYVARIDGQGSPAMSRPCTQCAKYLRECGVRKVIYTDKVQVPVAA